MKIGIIGAGISGLSVGKMLEKQHDVEILERNEQIGGIARTKDINGIAYHTVGGHCFNSKNPEVMDFVFNEILPEKNWHMVNRVAKINFKNNLISYPIEFAIKEIYQFDQKLAYNITQDFLKAEIHSPQNLEEWFIQNFGETLSREYLIPYNKKIWQIDPSQMSHLWVEGKLPKPNKVDFFNALIKDNQDTMPHSKFYYPNSNNQNTFIEALSTGQKINLGYKVDTIEKTGNEWIVNGHKHYDLVISTVPLNVIPFLITNTPEAIKQEAKKLRYNKVTNMLWKTKDVDATWTYYPDADTIFHRHIHIGSFFSPKQNYTITESMGEKTYEEMVEHGKKIDYLLEPVDYHVSDYAYVVYDENYQAATTEIKNYLSSIGFHTLGRFGEWEYYNMDICIESAIALSKKITTS